MATVSVKWKRVADGKARSCLPHGPSSWPRPRAARPPWCWLRRAGEEMTAKQIRGLASLPFQLAWPVLHRVDRMVPGTPRAARTRPPRPAVPRPPTVLRDGQLLQQEARGAQTPSPRSGRAWKFTRAVMTEGHCWEWLHSADTVSAQMETAGVQAGPQQV